MAQTVGTGGNTPQQAAVVTRLRRPSPTPKSTPSPQKQLGPVFRSQPQQQSLFHVAPQQQQRPQQEQQFFQAAPQQQPLFQVAPAPTPTFDFSSGPKVAELFQQKKPLSVQVVPQQQQPLIIQQAMGDGGWMDGTFPTSPWVIDEREATQKVTDQAKLAERARLRKEYEANDQTETAQALTPKQWAALSPLQQAAAQANYDLSLAVKKDFETKGKHKSDDTQIQGYQDRVKELFGEEEALGYKGLDYAPNTIAFLDSRGVEAANLAGRTLDDLISGEALVTTDIFEAMGEKVKSPDVFHNGPADTRGQKIHFAQQLAKGQLAYQEKLASKLKQGEQLLTDITSASTDAAASKSYGALQTPTPRAALTDVRPETLAQFDMYMEALARTDSPLDQALEAINLDLGQRGATPKESAQVWEGLIERSRQATTGEGKWFDGVDFPMRSPVEVAQALGAPTLKRQATLGAE